MIKPHRLIFRGVESFGDKFAAVEKKVQSQQKEPAKKADIIDESRVDAKVAATEMAIDKSSVKGKYKEEIKAQLKALVNEKNAALQQVDTNTEAGLKEVFRSTLAALDQFNQRPEVKAIYEKLEAQLNQLPAEIEKVNAAEKALSSAAVQYINNLMANGKSRNRHEEDFVNYLEAYGKVLKSAEGVVRIVESTNIPAAKQNLNIASLISDKAAFGGMKVVNMRADMPKTVEDLKRMQKLGESTLLMEKSNLYARGNPKFAKEYNRAQDAVKAQLHKEVDEGVNTATKADKEKGLDDARLNGLKKSVADTSAQIVNEFDGIRRMQINNPVEAYKKAQQFNVNLQMLHAGNARGFNIDIKALTAAPNLLGILREIADKFAKQTEFIMADIIHNHKDIVQYRDDISAYEKRSELFLKAATRLFEQIKQGIEVPGESFMAILHEGARELLESPLRHRIQQSKAPSIIRAINNLDYTNNDINDLAKFNQKAGEYMGALSEIASAILRTKGSADNFKSFAKHLGKDLAVVSASIAGAVALGMAAAATGGVALAGAPALSALLTAGITGTAAGLGATVGAVYGKAAIEGSTKSLTEKGFEKKFMGEWAKNSAYAIAFLGAGKILQLGGSKLGTVLSKAKAGTEATVAEVAVADVAKKTVTNTLRHGAKHVTKDAAKDAGKDFIKHEIDHSLHEVAAGKQPKSNKEGGHA